MQLSQQFPQLFKRETYAVNLALVEERQLENVFDTILAKRPIDGVWDQEYSLVPIGALGGRREGTDIPQKNMTMGYTTQGAVAIEATGKVGLSKILKDRSREFRSAGGDVNESKFAGHIADTASRSFLIRRNQRFRYLASLIFNKGGIQAGDSFFNHRDRTELSALDDTNLIYDGKPLFARPSNAHTSYASGATVAPGTQPVGSFIDYSATITDTGGYFNAFDYPPAYWALKRVVTHYTMNMQFDDNDERETDKPDTLFISGYNLMEWTEILQSKFIEPNAAGSTTNIENIFMMEGAKMNLVASEDLIANTWFVGKANSQGILILDPSQDEDPWAYWRDEKDRSYWVSYEDMWGFMIRNWRRWCAGAISTDGSTSPTFGGADQVNWHVMPSGI